MELRLENVFTAYDRVDVLEDVTLRIDPGAITCLLGSNGSGKTTVIRSILGLTPPHRIIAEGIACIPEGRKVFPRLTVAENLRLGGYLEKRTQALAEWMDRVF